jgi:fermentation-respiration switch protein FrsA (DUF1100 family)
MLGRAVIVIVLIVVLMAALMWTFQRKLIYFPDTMHPALAPGATEISFPTSDGLTLHSWLVPAVGPPNGISVLVAHGNGGNRAGRMPLATALAATGFSVLLLDYRGYGGNPGSPTEQGLIADAQAARSFLGSGPVIYFGESLGTGVVTALALSNPPLALVLRSPFTSLADAGSVHYPFLPIHILGRDKFPVLTQIAAINVPTVVIFGTNDTIVPAGQSRLVAASAAGPVTIVEVPGADHNDRVLLDGPDLIAAITSFAP